MVAVQTPRPYRDCGCAAGPSFYRRPLQRRVPISGGLPSATDGGRADQFCCGGSASGIGLIACWVEAGWWPNGPAGRSCSTSFQRRAHLEARCFPIIRGPASMPHGRPWRAGPLLVIQHLESYVITPRLMQHQLKLLPGLTPRPVSCFTGVVRTPGSAAGPALAVLPCRWWSGVLMP